MNKLAKYFVLEADVATLGVATEKKRQMILFLGVAVGAVLKEVYDALRASRSISWPTMGCSLIASLVVFPGIYRNAGLDQGELSFAKWCVAFQNGFFWSVLMDEIASARSAPSGASPAS